MVPLISAFSEQINLICIIGMMVVVGGYILKKLRQPYLILYILIGVAIGQSGLNLIENESSIRFIGELGIIILFFFIGMEVDLTTFVKDWKFAFVGTLSQIALSIGIVLIIGTTMSWTVRRSVVMGCVIALSSSAVVFKLIEEKKLNHTKMGHNVMSILLSQDIAIAPILICISILAGGTQSSSDIFMIILGGILFISIIVYVSKAKEIWFPFKRSLMHDHELQVFLAMFYCFFSALIASVFGLSEALGAFLGGLIMHKGQATLWIHEAIHSFRILFVAFFFISIGAQLDLNFIIQNMYPLGLVILCVYVINQLINTLILKLNNNSWSNALIGGAMLAQIGELSFLICLSAFSLQMLSEDTYHFTLSLISMTIIISPFWVLSIEKLVNSIRL